MTAECIVHSISPLSCRQQPLWGQRLLAPLIAAFVTLYEQSCRRVLCAHGK